MLKRVLALILLVMLFIPAAHAEEYVTVQALYQETRTPWQATYFFPNGEDYAALSANYSFSVDLIPSVPDVERFPVLLVKTVPIQVTDKTISDADQHKVGKLTLRKGSFKSNRQSPRFFQYFYDEMETARDNPLTPDDAAQVALSLWEKYLGVDNIQVRGVVGYDWELKFYGEYQHDDNDPDTLDWYTLDYGVYTVMGAPVFAGIPVLNSCQCEQNYDDHIMYYPYVHTEITLQDAERFELQGVALTLVEEMISDVPLLPFSRIREIYEQTLASEGQPILIVSAELGYRLVLAPGETGDHLADNVYMTQPVWCLRGYQPMPLWGSEQHRNDSIAAEQVKLAHVQGMTLGVGRDEPSLCIDAQTGEVIEKYGERTAQILTWEAQ